MADECVFCTQREIRARTIAENKLVRSFPTNIPIVPGHTLVIPQRHVTTLEEMTARERGALFTMVEQLKNAMRKEFGAEGFNFAWNEAPVAGQSVPHFHLHLLPRKSGDTGITKYEPRDFLYRPGSREPSPETELKAVALAMAKSLDTIEE